MVADRLSAALTAHIDSFAANRQIYYSPVSAWEIAMLGRPRNEGPRLRFEPDPTDWFDRFRAAPGVRELAMSSDIALAAALLPTEIHADPADRFLIATARHHHIPLVTGDRLIIEYGRQGLLDVLACRPQPDIEP